MNQTLLENRSRYSGNHHGDEPATRVRPGKLG